MRLFFALWPPADAASALERWAREAQRASGGNVTARENIHLTLAFLGEAGPRGAIAAARRVAGRRHVLPIEEARYWGKNGRPKNGIVWAGPRQTPPALLELFESLKVELEREGFALEKRRFAAHVTLVRKAGPGALPVLAAIDWPVSGFALVRSTLSSAGSSYETLEAFPVL